MYTHEFFDRSANLDWNKFKLEKVGYEPAMYNPFWPALSRFRITAPNGAVIEAVWCHGGEGHVEGCHNQLPVSWAKDNYK